MPLLRLLYSSQSRLRDGRLTVDEQVTQLARISAERNTQTGITGALLFIDGKFLQVIEGDADAVESTFERICCSFRHEHVKLIDIAPTPQRMFAEWQMALLCAEGAASSTLLEELANVQLMAGVNARTAVDLLHDCLRQATARGNFH